MQVSDAGDRGLSDAGERGGGGLAMGGLVILSEFPGFFRAFSIHISSPQPSLAGARLGCATGHGASSNGAPASSGRCSLGFCEFG